MLILSSKISCLAEALTLDQAAEYQIMLAIMNTDLRLQALS
ncbi:hypothetical protein SVI_3975 [Shewanella violacea DSS12]|uniref:Uncharacterized protein n=1 Tax=Shewanella violacea (strain JCM 10179 / CIP 106290 / LMG 19151 / DSS12) TaxID=637905 RepID=D4ZDN5_SHEVD|nr:hypothetical protein SVI_3975 [Shewanella violacea DSS12]